MRASSSCRILFSSLDSPPPPYSAGHVGAVQPREAILSIQTLVSGLGYDAFRPPHGISRSGMGVRMEAGQFSSSQARVSARKVSSSDMFFSSKNTLRQTTTSPCQRKTLAYVGAWHVAAVIPACKSGSWQFEIAQIFACTGSHKALWGLALCIFAQALRNRHITPLIGIISVG